MQSTAGFLGSSILEVVIGLSFLYFLLSVIASSVNELIASNLKWRAKDLERALLALLGPALFKLVAGDPLLSTMGQNSKGGATAGQLSGRPSYSRRPRSPGPCSRRWPTPTPGPSRPGGRRPGTARRPGSWRRRPSARSRRRPGRSSRAAPRGTRRPRASGRPCWR